MDVRRVGNKTIRKFEIGEQGYSGDQLTYAV